MIPAVPGTEVVFSERSDRPSPFDYYELPPSLPVMAWDDDGSPLVIDHDARDPRLVRAADMAAGGWVIEVVVHPRPVIAETHGTVALYRPEPGTLSERAVVAWDAEGYALVPGGESGRLVRAVGPGADYGVFWAVTHGSVE
ncbi:hypothetical protein HMPREF0591_5246 [Mycobacterium parascrofulaceum ATCC BAA-614]|uniref:Uncharacterized protein n=1 Tax=Mycobacterium parascrofulaceum ATCC BAA-614 TaxID=525368 RepID=D5PGF2_9MYCO|nr:hypothetical protein [Mycobacterium parascrofulaceum]EFG74806.1 hypothetical protein HMPREF0591_5246 [Mycobacterium parascrofulaceum ATCC BAA-614]